MAEIPDSKLIGQAIVGHEFIYPKVLFEPKQLNTEKGTVYFTHLVKGVGDKAKQRVINDGGFKGNSKKYDENIYGEEISAKFSWWSVYIDDANATRIKGALRLGQETPDIYNGVSKFGPNMFLERLDYLIECYERCIQGMSEIRVLSTFEYKREIQHSVVVVPEKHERFQDHDLFAYRDYSGFYHFKMDHIMKYADNGAGYVWHPFSTITWDNNSSPPKQRYYAHLAFAFYLDPLPREIMFVPTVEDLTQWKKDNSEFEIGRPLKEYYTSYS